MWRQNISIILPNRETEPQNDDPLLCLYNLNLNLKQGTSVCLSAWPLHISTTIRLSDFTLASYGPTMVRPQFIPKFLSGFISNLFNQCCHLIYYIYSEYTTDPLRPSNQPILNRHSSNM